MADGTLTELWRYPVKSMRGERVDALQVDDRGAAGDRTHAVWREHKGEPVWLTAREAPRLLAWTARYTEPGATLSPTGPPEPDLTAPDGSTHGWGNGTADALAQDLGRPVTLKRDTAGQQDLGRSLLVTTVQSHAALERELGRPVDARRWRTNLHLDLPDTDAWAELTWEGGRIELEGGVVLDLLHPCERCAIPTRDPDTQVKDPSLLKHLTAEHGMCFGINARVRVPGTLREGARVTIAEP
jgi:uncharacterized protein